MSFKKDKTTATELLLRMKKEKFEQVAFSHDQGTGLRTIIAIHSRKLGPALGGCRFYPYATEEDAIVDVMRLAKAMTYKAALTNLPLGGGKAVIMGDPQKEKTEPLMFAFGKVVERLGGAYITTVDSGTSPEDMSIIKKATSYVAGLPEKAGGVGGPSPITALGVTEGIRACVKHVFGSDELKNKKIAIQGIGHVGFLLAQNLKALGADLIVADTNEDNIRAAQSELDAKIVDHKEIFSVPCDVFSPCALGSVLNKDTVNWLNTSIIAGAANNQLASEEVAEHLLKKKIVYAPDFAINAGGLIHIAYALDNYDREKVESKTKDIYYTVEKILERSKAENTTTSKIAIALAKEKLEMIS